MKHTCRCGTEFEGKFCPNCGAEWRKERTCPKCGTTLPGNARFCNNCGYAFSTPRSAPGAAEATKANKKTVTTVVVLLILAIALAVLIPYLIAHKHDGTYYAYNYITEEYNYSEYFTLKGNKLSDQTGATVEVEFDGDNFKIYSDFFGSQMVTATGAVKKDIMKISVVGISTFAKKNHYHSYGDWETSIEATCIVNGLAERSCLCGHSETREIEKTGEHNFQDGVCTVCGAGLKYESVEGGYSVVGFEGDTINGSLVIPNTHEGLPIVSIGSSAFKDKGLTGITIPDSVTSIGSEAFYGCGGLTSITIGSGVTSIGAAAFYGCSGLTSITIPDSVTSIGKTAFGRCSELTSITVSDRNSTYHSAGNCVIETAAKTLILGCKTSNIPEDGSVTLIGDSAFLGCSGLTSINIPDGVTSIGNSAFDDCGALEKFIVGEGNSAYSSQDGVLYNKDKTEIIEVPKAIRGAVTIPDGVTEIGAGAFYDCYGLTSITIPDSVTSIGDSVFRGCSGLTNVTIPDSVTSIGSGAFYGIAYCNNESNWENGNVLYIGKHLIGAKETLSGSYTVGEGTKTIGEAAFAYCSGLTSITIPDSVTSIGNSAFYDCDGLTSVTIGNGVTSIGDSAFEDCIGLTSVTIGNGVTSIGNSTFYDCGALEKFIVGEGNNTYSSQDGVLYNKDKTKIIEVPKAIKGDVTIPDSVTSIGNSAFYDCDGLTSVTIGSGVTSIGKEAFYDCDALEKFIVGEGNNTYSSQDGVLYNKDKTKIIKVPKAIKGDVTIPDSVTSIGNSFEGCSGLTSVTIGNGVTSIGQKAFENCGKLKEIHYNGTIDEWQAIYKYYWDTGIGDYTIFCTDGTIDQYGTVTRT